MMKSMVENSCLFASHLTISFFAAIAGLVLLNPLKNPFKNFSLKQSSPSTAPNQNLRPKNHFTSSRVADAAGSDLDPTERVLIMMVFAYWLVFCCAKMAQPMLLPQWELAQLSLKLTGVLAYLLTFTCVLSLPLHRFAAQRQSEL
jgi:hypothetical protein